MELAVSEAKRAGDRGDYPIGAVITRLTGRGEVVIASAGNRVKTSGSSIKHVELETLKYVSSGYGRYLPDFVLYSTHEPCAMCAGACVWSRIGAVVYGVSQEDIAAFGRKRGTEDYKWRACLIPCRLVFEKGNYHIPVTGGFLRKECQKTVHLRDRASVTDANWISQLLLHPMPGSSGGNLRIERSMWHCFPGGTAGTAAWIDTVWFYRSYSLHTL